MLSGANEPSGGHEDLGIELEAHKLREQQLKSIVAATEGRENLELLVVRLVFSEVMNKF